MATGYKIGDIVQLKSGGPKMTVTGESGSDDVLSDIEEFSTVNKHIVYTSWFAGSKKESSQFPAEALISVNNESTK